MIKRLEKEVEKLNELAKSKAGDLKDRSEINGVTVLAEFEENQKNYAPKQIVCATVLARRSSRFSKKGVQLIVAVTRISFLPSMREESSKSCGGCRWPRWRKT